MIAIAHTTIEKNMRGNDFMELRGFELVARRLSFSRAADEIGMTRGALSQIVKNLELRLGVQLLNRTTRSMSLTDAGHELLERLSPALNELVNAVGNIDKFRDKPSGKIRVLACHLGADLYLKSLLPAFSKVAPDVILEVHIDDAHQDLVSRGFDAAVRPEGQIEMDLIGVKLGKEQRQIIVASANYIQRAGRPRDVAELDLHPCIGIRTNAFGHGSAWKLEAGGECQILNISGPLFVNNHSFAMQAVLADMGLALVPEHSARPHLESGRIEQLMPHLTGKLPAFFLCYPKQTFATLAFRSFVDFIQQHREV